MKAHLKVFWRRSSRHRWLLVVSLAIALTLSLAFAQLWMPEEIIRSTSVARPPEEIGQYPDFSDTNAIAWARFSILHPREAREAREALKTADQKTLDEWKRLAILDPDGYRKAWAEAFGQNAPPPDPEAKARRDKARWAILNPSQASAEREQSKTPEERRRDDIAKFAILRPREFNELVKPFKTPAHLEKEALAAYALEHPKEFTELLKRAWEESKAASNAADGKGGAQ